MSEDITLVIELLYRGRELTIDRRRIARALRLVGLTVVEVRIVIGSLEQLVAATRQKPRLVAIERCAISRTADLEPASLAADGGSHG